MFDRRKGKNSDPGEPVAGAEPQELSSQPTPAATTAMNSRITAMIGASIKIKGDITGDENLVVEGQVEGQISLSNHDLTIGESGIISADLNAKTVQIHGTVNGDIDGSELVVVSKTGRVQGNIVAPRVTLEDGAQFKGSIDMSPGSAQLSSNGKKTTDEKNGAPNGSGQADAQKESDKATSLA